MPDDLLTEEDLAALEERLAVEERVPFQIAPPFRGGGPAILPPGPSPEFLRRQAMMMPLQPGTGVATGSQGLFGVVGPPPPTGEEQMLEQIRGQINAMEFKNANDALNAAVQFQHMREAQRLRSSGTPEEQILQRLGRGLFYQNPNVLPNMMRETRPVPQPTITNINGVPVLRSGLRGERATAVPRSALPEATMKPEVMEVEGERVIRLGPNRWQYLGKDLATKELPPSVEASIYKFTIDKASKALDLIPSKKTEERQALQQQIQEAADNLMGMVKRKQSAPAPTPPAAAKTGPFSTEQEARGAGHKAGDIVVLQINGKPTRVRLK